MGRVKHDRSRYVSRVDEALAFAATWHAGQTRKGTAVPYIVHPVQVAAILRAWEFDDEVVIAGLLHDVLEDTACEEAELATRFGATVAETVRWCSEPNKDRPWEERKRDAVDRMRRMPPAAKAVSCADKSHNLHTMADALERGEPLWDRFKRGADSQIDYHRRALAALSSEWDHPMLAELRAALRRIETATSAA